MKKSFVFIKMLLLVFVGCSDDNITEPNNLARTYFPMRVSDTWYYDALGTGETPYMKRTVLNQFSINGLNYYAIEETHGFSSEYSFPYIDTLRYGNTGKILRLSHGREYVLYDFSLNDGATYTCPTYSLNSELEYTVTFRTRGTVEINSFPYENCVNLLFDIPQAHDDEQVITFAPNIGIIKIMVGEGPTMELSSYALY